MKRERESEVKEIKKSAETDGERLLLFLVMCGSALGCLWLWRM